MLIILQCKFLKPSKKYIIAQIACSSMAFGPTLAQEPPESRKALRFTVDA